VRSPQDGQTLPVGHFLIGDDSVEIVRRKTMLRLLDSAGFPDLMLIEAKV
jgi:hypothetical protein